MKKLVTIVTATAIAGSALSATSIEASAGGGDVAAGLLGGFAAGAIIGSAVAPRPYYGPVYAPPPAYVAPAPVYAEPRCYWARGEAYWDGYRWVRPRVQVCD
jgi:hypothetical protein